MMRGMSDEDNMSLPQVSQLPISSSTIQSTCKMHAAFVSFRVREGGQSMQCAPTGTNGTAGFIGYHRIYESVCECGCGA